MRICDLSSDVCSSDLEHWRLELIGAVGAPEALDRGVCLPAGLQQIVNAQAPVPGTEVGVVAAPGAAGIGEDEDAFLVVHEGLRLAEIGRGGAALDGEAVAARGIGRASCRGWGVR